jgi:hypothetical protein
MVMFLNGVVDRRACLLVFLVAPVLAGCGESAEVLEKRERAEFDKQVERQWKEKWAWVDGLQFFEKGGEYVDSGEPGVPRYDKPQVLPLLERLSRKHGLKWQAVVDKKKRNMALAVVASYPDQAGIQEAVMATLDEEQKSFPLDILVQTGNRWLTLDFLTPEDSKFLDDKEERSQAAR